MAKKNIAGGLLGMLGQDPAQQASTLLRLGTMGVVREMTMAADRRVAARGGAPWTPSINRAKRQTAAAVRRQAPRGSVTRSAARSVAVSSRPNPVQRRAMRRESYRQQGESLTPEQLIAIPANELPPELAERRKEAMANRPRDEKGRFLPAGESPATAPTPGKPPGDDRRQQLEKQLRAFMGDKFDSLPPQARQQLERQIEQQVSGATSHPSDASREPTEHVGMSETPTADPAVAPSQPHPSPSAAPESPQQTPAQQTRESVQAVLGPQAEDAPQREPTERVEMPGGASSGPNASAASPAATSDTPQTTQPKQTPAQRKQENVQAVINSQLEDAPQPKREPAEKSGGWLDKVQTGLDAAGVADPTPIADGTNAVISLGRAAVDPERRREHLQNAAISAVSAAVPYIGDTAKLLKVGRAAKKAHVAREGTAVAAVGAQPSSSGGIGGTIRRIAGGAIDAMRPKYVEVSADGIRPVSRNGGRGGVRPQYSGGGQRPPGDSDQREGKPPIIEDEVRRNSSSGAPPVEPPRFGGPSPASGDDGGGSPRRQREEAAGIAAADTFTDKLKSGALAIAGLAGKAYLAVEGLQLLNRGVLALNRDLAQYNGTLAGSYARAENADIRRDMKRGSALSGPLSELQDEQTKLQDSMSELTTPIYGLMIKGLAGLTALANIGVSITRSLVPLDLINAFYEKYIGDDGEKDGGPSTGGWEFLRDVSDGKFDGFDPEDFDKRFPNFRLNQEFLNRNPKKNG